VLFPQSRVELQIFEPRYMRLITESLKQDRPFVVSYILKGSETQTAESNLPEVAALGCSAEIVDWDLMDNGLLAVTIEGRVLASVGEITRDTDGLLNTQTTLQEEPEQIPVPEEFSELIHLTHQLMQHPDQPYDPDDDMGVNHSCAATLGYCLASLLPIDESDKQVFMGLSPLLLLEALQDKIDDLQI
jgi:Lon protease-like protein